MDKLCTYLQVSSIDEIWHYDHFETYDPTSKTGGLFACYINTFLRLKQQTDGWPRDSMTDAEKDEYIEAYERVEGK